MVWLLLLSIIYLRPTHFVLFHLKNIALYKYTVVYLFTNTLRCLFFFQFFLPLWNIWAHDSGCFCVCVCVEEWRFWVISKYAVSFGKSAFCIVVPFHVPQCLSVQVAPQPDQHLILSGFDFFFSSLQLGDTDISLWL